MQRKEINQRNFKNLFRLTGAILVAQLAQIGMGVTDTIIVGHLSPHALSSVALGVNIWHPLLLFVIGLMMTLSASCAHLYGAAKWADITSVARQGMWLALFLVIPVIFILVFSEPILRFFSVKPVLIADTTTYLRALSIGLPAWFIFLVLRFVGEGIGRTRPYLIISLLGFGFNIFATYSLVFGYLGLPALGVLGSGLATAFTMWLMLIGLLILINSDHRYRSLSIWKKFEKPDLRKMLPMWSLGAPSGLALFAEASIFAISALLLGRFGEVVLSAHQITLNIASVTFMIPLSLALALTSTVGRALGEKDGQGAHDLVLMGLKISAAFMLSAGMIFMVARYSLPRLFTDHADVITLSAHLLLYAAIFQLSDGLQVTLAGALRGMKDTTVPMFITIFSYWGIGLSIGYWLGIVRQWQAQGLWAGLIIGLTSAALLLGIRYLKHKRVYCTP